MKVDDDYFWKSYMGFRRTRYWTQINSRWRISAILKIVKLPYLNEQELSYRKQIARQLRTQYVEGIYKPNYPVTLKSRLRVTQGH